MRPCYSSSRHLELNDNRSRFANLPPWNDGGMRGEQAKLWDLESFEMVASYVDSTPVQAVTFHGDGNHVITATQDHVKVRALYAAVRGFGSEQGD
jgi:WD40 repeat protein